MPSVKMAEALRAQNLEDLRAYVGGRFAWGRDVLAGPLLMDGFFGFRPQSDIRRGSKQNDVPLLSGSNKDEGTFFLQPTTADKFVERSLTRFGDQADAFLKLYPAGSDEEANTSQLAAFRDELAFVMRIWARAQTKPERLESIPLLLHA